MAHFPSAGRLLLICVALPGANSLVTSFSSAARTGARLAGPPLARFSLEDTATRARLLLSPARVRRLLNPGRLRRILAWRISGEGEEEDWEERDAPMPTVRRSPWSSPITVEAPGINGGDPWIGARGTDDDLQLACDDAMSPVIAAPIIPQWYPSRRWLWRKWEGTHICFL